MSEFNPVIVTIVEGLGLNFWSPEALPISILIVNNSEAEEAQASISLFAAGKPNVHTLSMNAHTSRDKALICALEKAKELGFTHAVTLAYPFEQIDALNKLLNVAKEKPEAFISGDKNDRRRVWPLSRINIENLREMPNFEAALFEMNRAKQIRLDLAGKKECESFSDRVRFILRSNIFKRFRK